MEIKVNVQKFANVSTKSVQVDRDIFMKDLIQFIDNIENKEFLDQDLYNKLIAFGINKQEFEKMISELQKFAEYDDDNTYIGFPYENWIEKLLHVYTDDTVRKV